MKDLRAAADRVFRDYLSHCKAPDEDTLFHFLNSLHSFSDKLKRYRSGGLHNSPFFIGLKALRNIFHHEAELLNKVSMVTEFVQPVVAELMRVCLVDRLVVEQAVAAEIAQAKRQRRTPGDVAAAFKWYGEVVDIEPAIFNVTVDVYEAVDSVGIEPNSIAFKMFEESYKFEESRGFDHHVSGGIACHAGDIDNLLLRMHKDTLSMRLSR